VRGDINLQLVTNYISKLEYSTRVESANGVIVTSNMYAGASFSLYNCSWNKESIELLSL
jgi:hypothetical protein